MTATSTPTLDMLPNMRDVAVVIAKDASENLAGVDVISVGPLYGDQAPGGMQYSVIAIVPNRDGKDFSTSHVVLDIGQDPFMATVYRTAPIIAFEEFFALAMGSHGRTWQSEVAQAHRCACAVRFNQERSSVPDFC